MKISHKLLDVLSASWIAIGIMIFLLGWCHWYYSIPLTLAIIFCLYEVWKQGRRDVVEISRRQLWLSFAVCIILMWLCGIGGYMVQSADNYWRNAMFRDLVNYSWPVYDAATDLTKSYYLAFWMLPALVAKLFHSMEAGFFMQLVWLSAGFELLFLQMCRWLGKVRVSYLLFFYLFSGMKIVECLLYYPVVDSSHTLTEIVNIVFTNGTPGVFHAGPMVQFLYDPFNQTIPLFLGMMLMLNDTRSRLLPFYYVLLLLYAPLPLVGLAPIMVYWIMRNLVQMRLVQRWSYIFNLENVIALLLLVVTALYLMSNNQSGHKGLRDLTDLAPTVYGYLIYIFFEFVIFMLVGYKVCRDKAMLWIGFATVCLFGWFQIGLHNDFCFRTNMPFIFILCLLVIKRYYSSDAHSRMRKAILAMYLIGGVPSEVHPALRWVSSLCIVTGTDQSVLNRYQHLKDVKTLYVMQQKNLRNDDLPSSFRCRKDQEQFRTDVGTKNSVFFRYIAK
jgi:hypothetical protein